MVATSLGFRLAATVPPRPAAQCRSPVMSTVVITERQLVAGRSYAASRSPQRETRFHDSIPLAYRVESMLFLTEIN